MTEPYLIFDFDGVLGDTFVATVNVLSVQGGITKEKVKDNLNTYFSKPQHGLKNNVSPQEYEKMLGSTARFGADMLDHGFVLFEEFIQEIGKIKTNYLAVVSSGSLLYISPKLSETGLKFTHILGFEDHHSKEQKVKKISSDWGVDLKKIYYFTDTVSDVIELRDCMDPKKIIGCSWGFHGHEILATALPKEQILHSFEDIQKIKL
jgi:hypothetical protein